MKGVNTIPVFRQRRMRPTVTTSTTWDVQEYIGFMQPETDDEWLTIASMVSKQQAYDLVKQAMDGEADSGDS